MNRKYAIKPKTLFIMLGTILLLGILVTGFYIHALTYTKIYPNVSVCGVNVGNLTKQEAEYVINEKISQDIYGQNISVEFEGRRLRIDVSDMFIVDVETTVENAYKAGRGSNIFTRLFGSVYAMRRNYMVPLAITEDGEKLKNKLLDFALDCEEGHSFYTFSPNHRTMTVDLEAEGAYILDVDSTRNVIIDHVANGDFDKVLFIAEYKITEEKWELLYTRMQIPAVNATMSVDESELIVEPHRTGVTVDKEVLFAHLESGDTLFRMDVAPNYPRLTEEDFSVSTYSDILGKYTTEYNNKNATLVQNIELMASLINGVVIAPGKMFSFNAIVGDRSMDRGFEEVLSGGDEGFNGGAGQVASTLYCAQLMADLETVQRKNHEFMISYVPGGMDADVEYGVTDYVFKNNGEYPIKIEAVARGGELTVRIMGTKTDLDSEIKIINHVLDETEFTTTYQQTDELDDGYTLVKQEGINGQTVDTYKIYYREGVEEYRDFLQKSTYKPVTEIILYGGQDSSIAY